MDTKTLCMGVLSQGDASGYEIKKVFEQAFSYFFVAGYGSIYPALADLTEKGWVACTNVEQEKRPMKKVYHLTEAGHRQLLQELNKAYPHHRVRSEFMVLTCYAHLLPQGRVEQVLEQRCRDIEATIAHIDSFIDEGEALTPGVRFTAGFGKAVFEAARDYIESHKGMLLADMDKGPSAKESK